MGHVCHGLVARRLGLLLRVTVLSALAADGFGGKGAIGLYEQLIVEDKVDAVMGPYGSTHTEAVAPVTEKHRKVMITPLAATTSIWEKGRRYIFMAMVLPPAELFLAGLIDMGSRNGLKTVAIIEEDALFPKAAGKGAVELAKKKGMEVVLHETYTKGTKDFSAILAKIKAANTDVFGMAASSLGDFIVVTRQMKEQDINVKMFGNSGAVAEFQQELGKTAEFAYGLSAWEPSLPNPGIKEFVAAYQREFNRAPSFHAAGAYASCQLLMEAARRTGSLDSDKLREELLKLKTKTIFSDYAVDERRAGVPDRQQGALRPVARRCDSCGLARRTRDGDASVPDRTMEPAVKAEASREAGCGRGIRRAELSRCGHVGCSPTRGGLT